MVEKALSELIDGRILNFLSDVLHWSKVNDIQDKAFLSINAGHDTLVVAPAASGKTEAAMIPIVNEAITKRPEGIICLYVSPLKALINDHFKRFQKWENNLSVKFAKWHGDVSPYIKNKILANPPNVLFITPESLESILINKEEQLLKSLSDLRYVIVDEIHYFANSDRGIQLNSIVERLEEVLGRQLQRIGLSATVGNPEEILLWLSNKHDGKIISSQIVSEPDFKIFYDESDEALKKEILNRTDKKLLIFSSSRAGAEELAAALSKDTRLRGHIFVHHSSIDKTAREESESEFKSVDRGVMISTTTLELGIDIGDLDIVVLSSPSPTCSSFAQKVGRSGRKYLNPKTLVFCNNVTDILINLAEVGLVKRREFEPIDFPSKPKDVLFQQIVAILLEKRRIGKDKLVTLLRKPFVFSRLTITEIDEFINYLIENHFVMKNDIYLTLGVEAERKFGRRNFLAVISTLPVSNDFNVFYGMKPVGTLQAHYVISYLKKGESFVLGGIPWLVNYIDLQKRIVRVTRVSKAKFAKWGGASGSISYLVAREVYRILCKGNIGEDTRYLQANSKKLFDSFMVNIKALQLDGTKIPLYIEHPESRVFIFTFAGIRVNSLLGAIMKDVISAFEIEANPFYCCFKTEQLLHPNVLNKLRDSIIAKSGDNDSLTEYAKSLSPFMKNEFMKNLHEHDMLAVLSEIAYDYKNLQKLIKENPFYHINEPLHKWLE